MSNKRRTRGIIIAAVVVVALLAMVRIKRVRQFKGAPKLQVAPTPVSVAAVRMGSVSAAVRETGVIVSETEAAISAQVAARCTAVYKKEGDLVKAGEVLARLDDEELRSAYEAKEGEAAGARQSAEAQKAEVARAREDLTARKAQLREAEATLEARKAEKQAAEERLAAAKSAAATQRARTARDKVLYENKAISQEQWEASQTAQAEAEAGAASLERQIQALENTVKATAQRVEAVKASVAQAEQRVIAQERQAQAAQNKAAAAAAASAAARARLDYTVIRAPYDAVITARLVDPGNLLLPGKPIFRILRPGAVKVRANVPQEILGLLKPGMPAALEVAGKRQEATISRVYPALGEAHLGTVEIDLERPPFGLGSGATVDVVLQTGKMKGLVAPRAALLESDHGAVVYVVEGDKLTSKPVTVKLTNDREAIVTGELAAGTKVVVGRPSLLMSLADGQQVASRPAEEW